MDHNFINVLVVMIPVSTVKVMHLTFFEVPKDMFQFFWILQNVLSEEQNFNFLYRLSSASVC